MKDTGTQAAILDAAIEEFTTKGFDAATTAGIAQRAGITQPLIHYHFDSKERLWFAAMDRLFRPLRAIIDLDGADLVDLTPVDRLKVLIRRFVFFSAQHPQVARLIGLEGTAGSARFDWLLENYIGPLHRTIQEALAAGQRDGWAKPLPVEHLTAICAVGATVIFSWPPLATKLYALDLSRRDIVEAHAGTLLEVLLDGIVRRDEQ